MGLRHIAILVIAVMIGMIFAGKLRALPLLSSLPQM